MVVLARGESAHRGVPRIVSWGMAGPGQPDAAVAQALGRAHTGILSAEQRFDEADFVEPGDREWALPSALAFLSATEALRSGRIRRALVTSSSGRAVSAAVLLEA